MLSRRGFLKTAAAGASLAAWPHPARAANPDAPRPNIVVIMADDMGYSDIGCFGGEIETPNLDALAHNGLRCTQFYNNAKCVPTRASLLTGLYSQQIGIMNGTRPLRGCVTVAEVLKQAGYRTLMAGKWHAEGLPTDHGFDRYYGLADGCCNFFNPGEQRPGEPRPAEKHYPRRWSRDGDVMQPYTPEDPDFYTTDAFTDAALDYLEEYKDEDKPFFLHLAYTAPHYPLHARPEDIAKYRGKYLKGWDAIRAERHARLIDAGIVDARWPLSPRDARVPAWEDIQDRDAWDLEGISRSRSTGLMWKDAQSADHWDLTMAVYAAMIDRMDQNIGRLVQKLEALGKREDTLILFLSDNGGCAEVRNQTPDVPPGPVNSYRTVDPPWANASNTPFRKYKRYDHEGGIATPLIANWPAAIKPGQIRHDVGHIIDLMPTCIALSGGTYPAEHGGKTIPPMPGVDLSPVLTGGAPAERPMLFWRYASGRAVRDGKWKLVRDGDAPWELYDMEADRTELNDLAAERPEHTKRLAAAWEAWWKRCEHDAEEAQS